MADSEYRPEVDNWAQLSAKHGATWLAFAPDHFQAATVDALGSADAVSHYVPLEGDSGALDVAQRLRAWAERATADPKTAGNALLAGYPGAGKTHAAMAMCRPAVEAGFRSLHVAAEIMAQELVDFGRVAVEAAVAPEVLLLDDLRTPEATTDPARCRAMMLSVMDERMLRNRPTLVTTNLSPADLTDAWGAAVFDRLWGGATVAVFKGPSRRLRR